MANMEPDEVRADYVKKLGDEFGNAYYLAHAEWCDLWLTWKQFKNLFCREPERVELMNRCGAGFFERVERFFEESVFLAICRLTDPIKTGSKSNLTVKLFQNFADTDARKLKMAELLANVEGAVGFARDWRNRRISHNDYDLMLGGANPLEIAKITDIDKAIAALHLVFDYVEGEYMNSAMFNEVIDGLNNEMVMLDRLYLGDEVFQDNMKSLERGDYVPLEYPEWLKNS